MVEPTLQELVYLIGLITLANAPFLILRKFISNVESSWDKIRNEINKLTKEIGAQFQERLLEIFDDYENKVQNDENMEIYDVLNPKIEELCKIFLLNRESGSIVDLSKDSLSDSRINLWLINIITDVIFACTIVAYLLAIDLSPLLIWPSSLFFSMVTVILLLLIGNYVYILNKTWKNEKLKRKWEKNCYKTHQYQFDPKWFNR